MDKESHKVPKNSITQHAQINHVSYIAHMNSNTHCTSRSPSACVVPLGYLSLFPDVQKGSPSAIFFIRHWRLGSLYYKWGQEQVCHQLLAPPCIEQTAGFFVASSLGGTHANHPLSVYWHHEVCTCKALMLWCQRVPKRVQGQRRRMGKTGLLVGMRIFK